MLGCSEARSSRPKRKRFGWRFKKAFCPFSFSGFSIPLSQMKLKFFGMNCVARYSYECVHVCCFSRLQQCLIARHLFGPITSAISCCCCCYCYCYYCCMLECPFLRGNDCCAPLAACLTRGTNSNCCCCCIIPLSTMHEYHQTQTGA